MKVKVDEGTCTGCAACSDICPEVFEMNDDNISKVKVDEVPAELQAKAKEAAESCPVTCIEVVE